MQFQERRKAVRMATLERQRGKGEGMNEEKEFSATTANKEQVVMRYCATGKDPSYSNAFAAGLDLPLMNEEGLTLGSGEHGVAHTGISVELPEGTFGLVVIRSGLGMKGLVLSNGIGVIDEDYRGEIRIPLFYHGEGTLTLAKGERVAQMIVVPYLQPTLQKTEMLSQTDRGKDGFGSSGRF